MKLEVIRDRHLQAVHFRFGLAQFFGVPSRSSFPQAQPKPRANAVLSATAGLDDEDLNEVMLYAQFRTTRRRGKRRQ